MHLYEKHNRIIHRSLWLGVAVFAAMIVLFAIVFSRLNARSAEREEALIESAVRRAAVTCYAVEGRYPESLDYLLENYGVIVDQNRYAVRYEIFAANVMPEVSVARLGGAS